MESDSFFKCLLNIFLSVFSGVGNKLLDKKSNLPEIATKKHDNVQIPDIIQDSSLDNITEVASIIRRLNKFLKLLNENRQHDLFTIAKLAQIMGLKSVGELENYFTGKAEPNFEFLKQFCDIFGVNYSWLLEEKGQPFHTYKQTNYDPFMYYSYIEDMKPESIYFIRSDNEYGYTFIVLKINNWKYEIIHRIWNISSYVGSGGESQIYGMYKLIKKLKEKFYLKCYGRILKNESFDLLYSGEKFSGSIIDFKSHDSPWWDDFTDINKLYAISSHYEYWYGKEFIAAQNVVKMFLYQENQ